MTAPRENFGRTVPERANAPAASWTSSAAGDARTAEALDRMEQIADRAESIDFFRAASIARRRPELVERIAAARGTA